MSKKYIFLATLLLGLFASENGLAQNNTYNMVIEMTNGTKINIRSNDVRDISFNNGELVMTGEDLNSLVEQQKRMQASIDSLSWVTRDIRSLVEQQKRMQANIDSLSRVTMNSLLVKYTDLLNRYEYLKQLCFYCDSMIITVNNKLDDFIGGYSPSSPNYAKRNKLAEFTAAPRPRQNEATKPATWVNLLRTEDKGTKQNP